MKIKITKRGHTYKADCTDLPGSPPVSYGNNSTEAVANLLLRLMDRTDAATISYSSDTTQPLEELIIKSDAIEVVARELSEALWSSSTLRHAMFEPGQFAKLCQEIILDHLKRSAGII